MSFTPTSNNAFGTSPCTLSAINATSSSCQTSYTPTGGPKTHVVTARYANSGVHGHSLGKQPIHVPNG